MSVKTGILSLALFLPACSFVPAADKVERGQLSKNPNAEIYGFDQLLPLKTKGSDALRVIIGPSFGRYHYQFDFLPLKAGCEVFNSDDDMSEYPGAYCGNVLVNGVRTDVKSEDTGVTFHFIVPAEDFKNLFDSVKYGMSRWYGSWGMLTDGTSVALELHNRGQISSINSNGRSADNPSAVASMYVKAIALAYGPSGLFPRSSDWHAIDDLEGEAPCNHPGLNEYDVDGFGVGDDACAVSLRATEAKN